MRRIGHFVLALAMITVAHLWVPRPVAACSCATPEVGIDSAGRDPGSSVFTAIAGPRVGDRIPVTITRWLKGVPPAGLATIEGDDPQSLCGPTSPPAGGHYLFVTFASETSRMAISGCSVQADLATPEGAALLARATGIFGPGTGPPTGPTGPPTGPTAQPREVAESDQATGDDPMLVPIAIAILFSAGLVAGLFMVLRPRRPR